MISYPFDDSEAKTAINRPILLYRFEFEESYCINSICIPADSFRNAVSQFCLILGESSLDNVQSIHQIF